MASVVTMGLVVATALSLVVKMASVDTMVVVVVAGLVEVSALSVVVG